MLGEIVVMAGGFLSFPIFARLLTKQEYGIMSLIGITVALSVGLSSAGIRYGSQRFYSEYEQKGLSEEFHSTIFLSAIIFGICGTLTVVLINKLIPYAKMIYGITQPIIGVAAFLIMIRVISSLIGCVYRIQERPVTFSIFQIASKYFGMGISIILVAICLFGVYGYFLGLVIGEALIAVIFVIFFLRRVTIRASSFSLSILKRLTYFGFPMVISGFASNALSLGDRYLIQYFMASGDVATYSIPYNLCGYISGIILTAFEFSFIPLIMRLWNESKEIEAQLEVGKAIRIYSMVALPIIFGLTVLGEDILVVIASRKYSDSAYLIPYLITGTMINGLFTPVMIGFQFNQTTGTQAIITLLACIFNILTNMALIPMLGLLGAAISTLLSYCALIVVGGVWSSRYFKPSIPWYYIIVYGICSVVMFGFLKLFTLYFPDGYLLIKIIFGLIVYSVLLLILDQMARNTTIFYLKKMTRSFVRFS